MKLIHNYKNAKAVIQQIKNNEWDFEISDYSERCYFGKKDGLQLWVSNGGFFCDIHKLNIAGSIETNAFGYLFRHWVWFAAAKQAKNKSELNVRHIKLY